MGHPCLETGKALIDREIRELSLKFNNEKLVFNLYEWTSYVDDLETCYQLEEKGSKVDKEENKGQLSGMRVSLVPDVPYAWTVKLMTVNKHWVGGNLSVSMFLKFLSLILFIKICRFCVLFCKKRKQVKGKEERKKTKEKKRRNPLEKSCSPLYV